LRQVIRLRKNEGEVFARYRDALTLITDEFLQSRKRISKRDTAEIYNDYIASEVRRIQQAITSKRKSSVKQLLAGAAGLFANVAVGAFALPVPTPVADVAKTQAQCSSAMPYASVSATLMSAQMISTFFSE
jgi:hypothetical protein